MADILSYHSDTRSKVNNSKIFIKVIECIINK
jgi:hypothetical protein